MPDLSGAKDIQDGVSVSYRCGKKDNLLGENIIVDGDWRVDTIYSRSCICAENDHRTSRDISDKGASIRALPWCDSLNVYAVLLSLPYHWL
jgi:hypothetical protein